MPIQFDPRSSPPDGSWFDSFFWKSAPQTPPMPALQPPPATTPGPQGRLGGLLPPPNISQMPPLPPNGSGTETAWGGPEVMTNAAAAPEIQPADAPMEPGTKSYSFMDNPGASDALVAFGAAMLKAPTFNQGLGDAALAVNQVAQRYRMPTEQDYARARQLGMVARIARGYDENAPDTPNYGSATMGYAPLGPNGEDIAVPAFLDPARGYVYQMPDGSMSPQPPQGWVKATDSTLGSRNRYDTKEQSELQSKVAAEVRSANLSVSNYRQMLDLVDTSGVGSDLRTRLASNIARLGGYNFDGIDVSDQAVFNQKFKELNIDFAQKLQGQGQITEYERQIIAESLPQAGMNADAAKRVLNAMIAGAERKQEMWRRWNMDPGVRERFNNRYEIFEAEYLKEADAKQRGGSSKSGSSQPAAEGSTSSGIKWSVTE